MFITSNYYWIIQWELRITLINRDSCEIIVLDDSGNFTYIWIYYLFLSFYLVAQYSENLDLLNQNIYSNRFKSLLYKFNKSIT